MVTRSDLIYNVEKRSSRRVEFFMSVIGESFLNIISLHDQMILGSELQVMRRRRLPPTFRHLCNPLCHPQRRSYQIIPKNRRLQKNRLRNSLSIAYRNNKESRFAARAIAVHLQCILKIPKKLCLCDLLKLAHITTAYELS